VTTPRRLIVEVRGGPLSGAKALVVPGESLRVGRTEQAHLIIPRDQHLSGLHCELTWDGVTCTLRDAGSAEGTHLSGERIGGPTAVPHGGWIKVGETSLMVYREAFSPPRLAPLEPALAAAAAQARAALGAHQGRGRLHAVLDAARDERVLELLREAVDPHRSLYDGVKGEALADVAPYLVTFRRDSGLLDRLLQEGWGRSWGVFLTSGAPPASVRRHFRRFLLVEDEDAAERMYFRFYDPRVLREFMPIATPRQKDDLFEGLDAILLEGEDGELVTHDATASRPARAEESNAQDG
jgi:hypothetical protein